MGFSTKNTGVSNHSLLQIFPTQGLNLYLLHWQKGSFTVLAKVQMKCPPEPEPQLVKQETTTHSSMEDSFFRLLG